MRDFLIVVVVVHASFTSEEGIYSKMSRQSAGENPACGAHHTHRITAGAFATAVGREISNDNWKRRIFA